MKIVSNMYIRGQRICIMDSGEGITASDILGESTVGKSVVLKNGRYVISGGADEACPV